MYQFNVKYSVVEVRESLTKMVRRGHLPESRMVQIVKKYEQEKKQVQDGQRFITIIL